MTSVATALTNLWNTRNSSWPRPRRKTEPTFTNQIRPDHGSVAGHRGLESGRRSFDPFDLIDRLAKSTRVRQSIIRHAFRFYMGRNEMMSDQTLLDADQAYVRSGSFNEVIISPFNLRFLQVP